MSQNKKNVVVIDVKKWCRGNEHDEHTGKYCAVGFAREQGVNVKVQAGDDIKQIDRKYKISDRYDDCGMDCFSDVESAIICVNDSRIRGATRRKILTELFRLAGVDLKFKNLPKAKVKAISPKKKN